MFPGCAEQACSVRQVRHGTILTGALRSKPVCPSSPFCFSEPSQAHSLSSVKCRAVIQPRSMQHTCWSARTGGGAWDSACCCATAAAASSSAGSTESAASYSCKSTGASPSTRTFLLDHRAHHNPITSSPSGNMPCTRRCASDTRSRGEADVEC